MTTLLVDGSKYPLTREGIQSALNDAASGDIVRIMGDIGAIDCEGQMIQWPQRDGLTLEGMDGTWLTNVGLGG